MSSVIGIGSIIFPAFLILFLLFLPFLIIFIVIIFLIIQFGLIVVASFMCVGRCRPIWSELRGVPGSLSICRSLGVGGCVSAGTLGI